MLLKYTFKNIFSKPGRLIVLVLCLTIACLAGFLALDFGGSITDTLNQMTEVYGGDYIILDWGSEGVTSDTFEGTDITKVSFLGSKSIKKREITRREKLYNYAITEEVNIASYLNPEIARAMKMIKTDYVPGLGEIAISKGYSEKYGYNIGDKITVYNDKEEPTELNVSHIYDKESYLGDISGLISIEQANIITNSSICKGGIVDVPDDYREEFESIMAEKHPNVLLTKTYVDGSILDSIKNITYILYLVFVLVFVLVIFVTVSFTEKIITERMSVIGTMRSIGMSMRKTTAILLFENVLYGLIGSGIALVLYLVLRDTLLSLLAASMSGRAGVGPINLLNCLIVIMFAILIQVLVPMSEVIKAVKTSIRDIIFDSRDGEYKISYPQTIIGFVLIAAGMVCGFLINNLAAAITAVLIVIVGAGLSIQFVVRKLTYAISKLFGSLKMPVAELAAVETGSKKPNSSNAVLAVAAVTAAATIFLIGNSILASVEKSDYEADIVISGAYGKTSSYEYINEIENVTDVKYNYQTFDEISAGGKEIGVTVMSLPDNSHYKIYGELPASLEADECSVDPIVANKLGISEGDTLDITFISTGVFPVKKTMRIVKVQEYSQFMSIGVVIVSNRLYKELYTDNVTSIFVTASDPVKVKTEIEDSLTGGETVKTMSERIADKEENTGQMRLIIVAVMAAAIILTLIGISGNQVIGFASRKKEYAMLHSCACPRSSIIKMILIENSMLFGVSCIVAAILCIPVTALIGRIFVMSDAGLSVSVEYGMLILCICVLWLITMLTSLSPIRSLRKMNTAMEMKYE